MKQRSRFEYGSQTFECSLPARAWTPADETIGGARIATAGIPASYVARRDAVLELALRIRETEWLDFLNLVIYGQSAQSFTWFPDTDEDASYDVWLHAPVAGDRWAPTRSTEFPRVLEVTLVLRGNGTVPWTPYF